MWSHISGDMLETRAQQQTHIQVDTLYTLAIFPVRCFNILTTISALSTLSTSALVRFQGTCASGTLLYLSKHTLSSSINVPSHRLAASEMLGFSGEHSRVLSAVVFCSRAISRTMLARYCLYAGEHTILSPTYVPSYRPPACEMLGFWRR